MKKVIITSFLLISFSVFCQANEIERINHLLETQTFYNIRLDYNTNLTLPDSVKEKFLIALRGGVPQRLADSILFISEQHKERIWEFSKNMCRGDSICTIEEYNRRIQEEFERRYNRLFNRYQVNRSVVLAAGSWSIKESIPILEKAIGSGKYDQLAVQMALARLGNDSIKQVLLERHTLAYVLQTTSLDTVSDNVRIRASDFGNLWTTDQGIHTAIYLQSKEMLLNILDLIYIRGLGSFCISGSCTYFPNVSIFISDFGSSFFRNFPNVEQLWEICDNYTDTIWYLHRKRRNRREQRELDRLLSTEHRTMIKNQIRDWIIENVNFE